MSSLVANPWRSERLIYQRIENKPESVDWIWNNLFRNPEIAALGLYSASPATREEIVKQVDSLSKTAYLLAFCHVIPDHVSLGSSPGSDRKDPAWDPALNLTPIGYLVVKRKSHPHDMIGTLSLNFTQQAQGKGYGTEAGRWALDWAFRSANLHAITTRVSTANPRSIASNGKMGMTEVGRIPEWLWINGKRYDEVIFYAQRDTWLAAEEHRRAENKVLDKRREE